MRAACWALALALGCVGDEPGVKERTPPTHGLDSAPPTPTDSATLPVIAAVHVSPGRLVAGDVVDDTSPITVEIVLPVTLAGGGLPEWLEAAQTDRSVLQVELPVVGIELADEDARPAGTFAPPRFCRVGDDCPPRAGRWQAWHVVDGAVHRELQLALGWSDLAHPALPVRNVIGVWLAEGERVGAGDSVRLAYQGPVPARATWTGEPLRPRVRWRSTVDPDCPASDRACWTEADPAVVDGWTIAAAEPAILSVHAPLDAVVGETDTATLVVTDRYGNPAPWTGQVTLSEATDAVVDITGWTTSVPITWAYPGPTRVLPTLNPPDLRAVHHWTVVTKGAPEFRRRIGDLHLHTGDGGAQRSFLGHFRAGDHAGLFTATASSLRYLHEVSGHDFGAVSEHAMRVDGAVPPPGVDTDPAFLPGGACVGPIEPVGGIETWWPSSQRAARAAERPGFVVFPAFEWQSHHDRPSDRTLNHRVVLFRDFHPDDGHPLLPGDTPGLSPRCLIRFLRSAGYAPESALVLPHLQIASDRNLDWDLTWGPWGEDLVDLATVTAYTPVAEIFSARSYVDRADGLRVPQAARFEGEAVSPAPFTFRYGWRDRSAPVGVIGASDGHTGAPGLDDPPTLDGVRESASEPGGAGVLLVREDGRDGLWEALRARRTYATTGHRGWLDLTIASAPMGSAISADLPSLEVDLATYVGLELARVEVWTARVGDPDWPWTAPYAAAPTGQTHEASFTLPNPVDRGAAPGEWVYYLRVLARWGDEPLDQAEAMWSSPIWVRWTST